jgi:dimethylaniline monooxygenase (N-oxide forming)
VAGLAATKNLIEQGFDVTAFDKNNQLGGLWNFKKDPSQTTVLRCEYSRDDGFQPLTTATHSNGSKEIASGILKSSN